MSLLLAVASAGGYAQTVPLPRDKPDAAEPDVAVEPKPHEGLHEGLSDACLAALLETGVVAVPGSAETGDVCEIEEPVAVDAVETRAGLVALPHRPVLDCRFATVLGAWLSEVVSPVADSLLGSPVETVVTGPGHQCRRRSDGKLSEHALANAIDITGFRLADGRTVRIEMLAVAEGAKQEFLRAISASACGYFTTVLGPGSDAAHADHLHIDLAERSTAEFRICMTR